MGVETQEPSGGFFDPTQAFAATGNQHQRLPRIKLEPVTDLDACLLVIASSVKAVGKRRSPNRNPFALGAVRDEFLAQLFSHETVEIDFGLNPCAISVKVIIDGDQGGAE